MSPSSSAGTALVTGASSGIGAAFAERFARDGLDVILVARREDRLAAAAGRYAREYGVAATPLPVDLATDEGMAVAEEAIAGCGSLRYVVNSAGIAGYMPFVELSVELAETLMALHVRATTRLTRAALAGMVARGSGAIINVSSGLAFSGRLPSPPLPRRAIYAAAKAYINTFTEILADELRDTGVQVQALCPGIVRTEFHEVAGYDVSHVPHFMEAEHVVEASLAGLALGETLCIPALGDVGLLRAFDDSRGQVFASVRRGELAARYLAGEGRE